MNQCMNCQYWLQSAWMTPLGDCSELIVTRAYGGTVLLEKHLPVMTATRDPVITHGTFGCTKFQAKDGQ